LLKLSDLRLGAVLPLSLDPKHESEFKFPKSFIGIAGYFAIQLSIRKIPATNADKRR